MKARRLARGCVVVLGAVAVLWLVPPIRAAQGGGRAGRRLRHQRPRHVQQMAIRT